MKNESAIKAFYEDVSLMKLAGINIIIVHGGGPEISKWLERTGVITRFVNGLRVTDSNVMDIVEMVLSGHVNKNLAAGLSSYGVSAVGISGRDCNLLRARKKYTFVDGEKKDIGFVGEVVSVNKALLQSILERGRVPVISPIGCDYTGNKYNINADYAASYISSALKAEKLIILTDVEGVYKDFNDKSTLIPSLCPEEIRDYINEGIINGGMIPKMECCMEAIENGTKSVHLLDGRNKHGILKELLHSMGTQITNRRRYEKCQKAI